MSSSTWHDETQQFEVYEPGDLVRVIPYHNEPIGTVIRQMISSRGAILNNYNILVGGELVGLHALSLRRVVEE